MRRIVFFLCFSLTVLLGIFVYQYFSLDDGYVHVIFCNVGQGDGVLIKEPGGAYFMLDSGPDERILGCLERNMPFWKRTISIAFLSHPHNDHFVGYLSVLRRYSVNKFVVEDLSNDTNAYKSLTKLIKNKEIQLQPSILGDVYKTESDVRFNIVGPSRDFLESTSPGGKIGESAEFANLIIHFQYKNFDLLFTGDSQILGLSEALGYMKNGSIDVMHVPHHGSRFGLSESVVEEIRPKAAVISVGKNNYGHPSSEILNLLKKSNVRYFRTDQYGDIEIVSNGEKFWIKTQ